MLSAPQRGSGWQAGGCCSVLRALALSALGSAIRVGTAVRTLSAERVVVCEQPQCP